MMSKKLKWISSTVIVIIALVLLWNNTRFRLFLYNQLTNHYHGGDKLYARAWIVNDTASYNINLYRRIRPLNEEDVNNMDIPLWQKSLIKKDLKPTTDVLMIETDWAISSDSLCKFKTACIGTYEGYVTQYLKLTKQKILAPFYSVHPNKKVLIKEEDLGLHKVPDGYTYDEGPFYITSFEVKGNKELTNFRSVR